MVTGVLCVDTGRISGPAVGVYFAEGKIWKARKAAGVWGGNPV